MLRVDRTDPDTNTFAGIDWGVWAGTTARCSSTWAPRRTRTSRRRGATAAATRSVGRVRPAAVGVRERRAADNRHGRLQRPYSPNPTATWNDDWLNYNLARFVVEATSYRVPHSYLYEPRPSVGRYYLSSNIWRDANSTAPWGTDLTKLFDQEAVLAGLRTLVPYFTFTGDTKFQNLGLLDPDQAMLQQAKQDGDDVAGAPFTAMHTPTAMSYLDANKSEFERGGDCYTTIPDLEAVVEKHDAWDLPLIVGGVATNSNGVPWGSSPRSTTSSRPQGRARAGRGRCTSSTRPPRGRAHLHLDPRAQPLLGLAHPHDTIGKAVVTTSDGTKKAENWDGTTGRSTRSGADDVRIDQLCYSILDQETIARGHLAYDLEVDEPGAEGGGEAFAAQRHGHRWTGCRRRRGAAAAEGDRQHGEGAEALRRVRLRQRDLRRAEGVDRRRRATSTSRGLAARHDRDRARHAGDRRGPCPSASPANWRTRAGRAGQPARPALRRRAGRSAVASATSQRARAWRGRGAGARRRARRSRSGRCGVAARVARDQQAGRRPEGRAREPARGVGRERDREPGLQLDHVEAAGFAGARRRSCRRPTRRRTSPARDGELLAVAASRSGARSSNRTRMSGPPSTNAYVVTR